MMNTVIYRFKKQHKTKLDEKRVENFLNRLALSM